MTGFSNLSSYSLIFCNRVSICHCILAVQSSVYSIASCVNSIKHVVFNYLIVNPDNNTFAGIVYSEDMTQKTLGYMQLKIRWLLWFIEKRCKTVYLLKILWISIKLSHFISNWLTTYWGSCKFIKLNIKLTKKIFINGLFRYKLLRI